MDEAKELVKDAREVLAKLETVWQVLRQTEREHGTSKELSKALYDVTALSVGLRILIKEQEGGDDGAEV